MLWWFCQGGGPTSRGVAVCPRTFQALEPASTCFQQIACVHSSTGPSSDRGHHLRQERCKEAVLPVVLGKRAIAIQNFVVMPEKSLSDLKNLKPSVRGKRLCPLQAKCLSSLEVNIPCGVSEIVTQCQMPFLSSNHALSNYMCSERPALWCFGLQSVSEGHELQRLICFGFLSSYAQSHGNTRVFHLQVCSNTRFLPHMIILAFLNCHCAWNFEHDMLAAPDKP